MIQVRNRARAAARPRRRPAPRAVTGDLGDVGAVDAAGVGRLLPRRRRRPRRRRVERAGDRPGPDLRRQRDGGAARSDSDHDGRVRRRSTPAPQQFATQGTVRFRASGTYQGRPAVVLGIDTDRRTIVFVVAADDCTQVLYSASR